MFRSSMPLLFFVFLSVALVGRPDAASASVGDVLDAVTQGISHTAQVAAVAAAASSSPTLNSLASGVENNQDLVAITRPAIVRIVTHVSGTSTVPAFSIDFKTLAVSAAPSGKPISIPFDGYFTGSGFIVSSDGYILTAAHVVTDNEAQLLLATKQSLTLLLPKLFSLTPQETAELKAQPDANKAGEALALNFINYVRQHMTPYTTSSVVIVPSTATAALQGSAFTTTVQNSTSEGAIDDAKKIFSTGIPLTVVAANSSFIDDEKDVALGKVAESNLPTMHIADSAVEIAQRIYAFGYPSTADYAGLTSDPSFTSGSVNALKDSTLKTFKYLQTDAKISTGSSGGPLFDADGNAVGIVVKVSAASGAGDTFAFAVPIGIAKDFLSKHAIELTNADDYTSHFLAGVSLEQQKHCKAAIDAFTAAASANSIFGNIQSYVSPHIAACTALIASGGSIDNSFDAVRAWLGAQGALLWMVVGAVLIAVLIAGMFIMRLLKRLKKEEKMISGLNQQANSNAIQPALSSTTPPIKPAVDPQVLTYVANSRKAGISDDVIRTTLTQSGWDAGNITAALA